MIIGNNYPQNLANRGNPSSQDQNTGNFLSQIEDLQAKLDKALEGVTCEEERSEIVNELLGGQYLGRFNPDKQDDVLTPETRYQLTQEDKDYFAQKYDIGNMTPGEMDEMLCELEDMGAITQSERLAVNPYMNADGSFKSFSQVVIIPSTHTGEGSSVTDLHQDHYGGDPLGFWAQRLRTLEQELVTGGATVDKEAHRQELAGTQAISALVGGIFGQSPSARTTSAQNSGVPYGQHTEDSTLESLKRSLDAMLQCNYDRLRLDIIDEEEEEQKQFEAMLDMVDKAIQDVPDETLAEDLMEELVGEQK